MRSNYKPIGNYIRLVDDRNKDLKVTTLLGLSISKVFIPSVANIIGSDMANYKIIRKGQFSCSLMQVRRDKKMPVALLRDFEEAIISQAYPVFEIIDHDLLDPEYLMMWMSRSEFDRHACFLAVGGVRGSLEWEDFCEMELPVPSIEKQREILREYNTIVNRIQLNEQLNQKLEETAQAIYKHWFVDFEFPISAEYAASIGKPELEGKAYKSSGGDMVFCEELEQEIPKDWELNILEKILTFRNGKTRPQDTGTIPVYGGNGIMDYADKHNNEDTIVVGRVGAYCGSLYRVKEKCWVSDNAIFADSKISAKDFSFYLLKDLNINDKSEGTGQPLLTQGILNSIKFIEPTPALIKKFDSLSAIFLFRKDLARNNNSTLNSLATTVLQRMSKIVLLELTA